MNSRLVFLKRFFPPSAASRRGGIVVLAAVFLVILLGFVAFSIDVGHIAVAQAELQNAADAAALAGARALFDSPSAARAAASQFAGEHTAAGEAVLLVAASDVEIGHWDSQTATFTVLTGQAEEDGDAVRVTCRRTAGRANALRLFFAPVLGSDSADVTATAIACAVSTSCGLIVGIEGVNLQNGDVDSYDSSLGSYSSQTPGAEGHVCSDGNILVNANGSVRGDARPGEGGYVERPANVTGSTAPRSGEIPWKPIDSGDAASVNDNTNIPAWAWSGNSLVLDGSEVLTLPAGTYYLAGGLTMSGTSQLRFSGEALIYVNGNVDVAGGGIVNESKVPGNLQIKLLGSQASFRGTNRFYADLYAPTTNVTINGNAGFYGAVVAKTLAFAGDNAAIHADEALTRPRKEMSRTVLAQ